jgi:hypothetical protein
MTKNGRPLRRRAGIEQSRNARMVHSIQCFTLRGEAGQDLPRIHAWIEHLDGDRTADRFLLLRAIDGAEAAAAEQFVQQVVTQPHG